MSVHGEGQTVRAKGPEERLLLAIYEQFGRRVRRTVRLLDHLVAVGMQSTQEYKDWCIYNNFAPDLLKSPQQRRTEVAARENRTKLSVSNRFKTIVEQLYAGTSS